MPGPKSGVHEKTCVGREGTACTKVVLQSQVRQGDVLILSEVAPRSRVRLPWYEFNVALYDDSAVLDVGPGFLLFSMMLILLVAGCVTPSAFYVIAAS